MIDKTKIKTVLFDYDGTLHNTLKIYEKAFKTVYESLVRDFGAPKKTWQASEIAKFLGQTPTQMWSHFGEDLSDEAKQTGLKRLSKTLDSAIQKGQAELYDGALEVLDYLKQKGYYLVFISNCKQYYLEAHKAAFGLDRYFDLMVCSETFEGIQDKDKVLAQILPKLPKAGVIVGDRHHDMEAGIKNGLYTIGVNYGFGNDEELSVADMRIDDIKTLKTLL